MKINFLFIILLSLFYFILNIDFDLPTQYTKNFTFTAGTSYKFYIKVEDLQKVYFSLKSDSKFGPNQKLIKYHYSDRYSKKYDWNTTFDIGNSSSFEREDTSYSKTTLYVAFEIIPEISMSQVKVSASVRDSDGKKIAEGISLLLLMAILIPVIFCCIIGIIIAILVISLCGKKGTNNTYNNNYPNPGYIQPIDQNNQYPQYNPNNNPNPDYIQPLTPNSQNAPIIPVS